MLAILLSSERLVEARAFSLQTAEQLRSVSGSIASLMEIRQVRTVVLNKFVIYGGFSWFK
jgi:hypothetical protein